MDQQRSRIGLLIISFVFGTLVSIFLVFFLLDYFTVTTISIAFVIGIAIVGLIMALIRSKNNKSQK